MTALLDHCKVSRYSWLGLSSSESSLLLFIYASGSGGTPLTRHTRLECTILSAPTVICARIREMAISHLTTRKFTRLPSVFTNNTSKRSVKNLKWRQTIFPSIPRKRDSIFVLTSSTTEGFPHTTKIQTKTTFETIWMMRPMKSSKTGSSRNTVNHTDL